MSMSRWVAWLVAMGCVCAGAPAQLFGGGPSEDAPTMSLRPAFDAVGGQSTPIVPCDRWLPFVLEIGPGDAGGVIAISYRQDATQRTTILTPFAATPGRAVRLPVYLSLPAFVDEIELVMQANTSDGRSVSRRQTLGGFGADPSGAFVPLMTGMDTSLLLWCGRTSLAEASFADPRRTKQTGVTFGSLEPDLLPHVPMGYDACMGLVLRPGELRGVSEQAKRAVREWVASGGRLVLVCEDAGSDWMSWLPEGVAQRCIDLDEPQAVELADLRTTAVLRGRSLPVRAVRVLPEGEANGWMPGWRAGASDLSATGPAGLGMVTILGADPLSLVDPRQEDERDRSVDRLWADALGECVGDVENTESQESSMAWGPRGMRSMGVSSGTNDEERNGIATALDGLAQAPPLGNGVFWGIGLSMLALVLLLGPVDYLVLKRFELRHRSWITALAWIGIASGAAMVVPGAMRSGDSQLTSIRHTDVVMEGGRTTGWSTGYMGVFSGSPMSPRLTDSPRGAWWRGVSGLSDMGQRAALKPLRLIQTPETCMPLPDEKASPMPMGLWMFRTLMEQSAAESTVRVQVTRALDEWDVRVEGLPEDVRAMSVDVRWAGFMATGLDVRVSGGQASVTIGQGRRTATMNGGILESPGPGTGQRTLAMRRRVQTGHWALVEMVYETQDGPYELSERMTRKHREVVRALVRLEDAEGASR